jgi:hypothetical protein
MRQINNVLFSSSINKLCRVGVAWGLLKSTAAAVDFGASFSIDDTTAGASLLSAVAGSVNNFTNLIMGPGIYLALAIGALIAIYGLGRGDKEKLFTGIGLFVFAAILRGIWSFLS